MKLIAAAVGLATATVFSGSALAAGLGRVTVLSALGEPLKARLEVTGNPEELGSAVAKLASAEAFRLAGIEYAAVLPKLKFSSDVKSEGGRRFVEITTDWPVNDPFVDMLVEFSWSSGRLVREYTFLLDPPEIIAQRAAVVVPPAGTAAPAAAASQSATDAAKPVATKQAVDSSTPKHQAAARDAGVSAAESVEVKRGDTLSAIAKRTKPADVSLDQMLVALFRDNSEAFAGNMNRLHAGAILRVPDADAVRSVDGGQARKEVVAQFADFNAYRGRLAEQAASGAGRDARAGQEASGRIAPRVTEKAAPASADADRLAVSRTGRAGGDAAKLSALEEEVVARDRALAEANSRIKDLEKNLDDLKRLAEMKSKAAAADASASKPTPAPSVSASKAETSAAPAVAVEKPAALENQASATKPEATPKTESAPKPEKKAKKAAPPPPPPPEPDFMEENGPLVFGGAGIVALLLGFLGLKAIRKKRKAKDEAGDAPVTQTSMAAASVFGSAPSIQSSTLGTITAEPSLSETQSGEVADSVDPLVEADTYLAFGKDAQAEEILLDALKASPTRLAIHVKLLEIYAARRSTMQFNTLAEDLKQQSRGRGQEWNRALVLGATLDPDNPLYRHEDGTVPEAPAAAARPDLQATMIFTEPVDVAGAHDAAPAPLDVAIDEPAQAPAELDFDLDLESSAAPENVTSSAGSTGGQDIDFDFDLSDDDKKVETPVVESAPASPSGLDIDFDLELPAAAEDKPAASAGDVGLDTTLQFEVSVADSTPGPSVDETLVAELPPVSKSEVDFDFDLSLPADGEPTMTLPEAAPVAEVASAAMATSPGLDLGAVDLALPATDVALETAAPEIATEPLSTPAPAVASAPDAGEADNPEAATKLELAAAYEEMGDRDGARELLEEVLSEGSATQQAAARAKIAQLG